jgi:hypothetical protein
LLLDDGDKSGGAPNPSPVFNNFGANPPSSGGLGKLGNLSSAGSLGVLGNKALIGTTIADFKGADAPQTAFSIGSSGSKKVAKEESKLADTKLPGEGLFSSKTKVTPTNLFGSSGGNLLASQKGPQDLLKGLTVSNPGEEAKASSAGSKLAVIKEESVNDNVAESKPAGAPV